MKWLIASDIHGSEFYCSKLLKAFEAEKAERLFLLGDLLYHGPRNELPLDYNPKGVISLLNAYRSRILCVRGNCDAEVDQEVLDFSILAEYAMITIGEHMIFAAHGHNLDAQKKLPLKQGDILLCGHTHVPCCEKRENYLYINPGSVSLPKENSYTGYLLLDGETFIWKALDGTVKQWETI